MNARIVEKAEGSGKEPELVETTGEGLIAALYNGRLIISFMVMESVGYHHNWDDRCLYYKAHPVPPTTTKEEVGSKEVGKVKVERA